MPIVIDHPTVIEAAGTKPKQIREFAGRVNSGHVQVSVARMSSPEGWEEPGQRPEFEEITVVLSGMLRVEYQGGQLEVRQGQAVVKAQAPKESSKVLRPRSTPTCLGTDSGS